MGRWSHLKPRSLATEEEEEKKKKNVLGKIFESLEDVEGKPRLNPLSMIWNTKGVQKLLDYKSPYTGVTVEEALKQTFNKDTGKEFGKFLEEGSEKITGGYMPDVISGMLGRTGQSVGGGATDVLRGTARGDIPGTAQAIYGMGKIAAPGTTVGKFGIMPFQAMSALVEAPQIGEKDLTRRFAKGYMRGMTGDEEVRTDVPSKTVKWNILGNEIEFDPVEQIGYMGGFIQNPVNKKIFKATDKWKIPLGKDIPKVGNIINFLAINSLRGGAEDFLMSLKDMPEDATNEEKFQFMLKNVVIGAGTEIGGRFMFQAGPNWISNRKMFTEVYDTLKKAVNTPDPDNIFYKGSYHKMPAAGMVAGVGLDEEGKPTWDWEKAMLGMGVATLGTKALGDMKIKGLDEVKVEMKKGNMAKAQKMLAEIKDPNKPSFSDLDSAIRIEQAREEWIESQKLKKKIKAEAKPKATPKELEGTPLGEAMDILEQKIGDRMEEFPYFKDDDAPWMWTQETKEMRVMQLIDEGKLKEAEELYGQAGYNLKSRTFDELKREVSQYRSAMENEGRMEIGQRLGRYQSDWDNMKRTLERYGEEFNPDKPGMLVRESVSAKGDTTYTKRLKSGKTTQVTRKGHMSSEELADALGYDGETEMLQEMMDEMRLEGRPVGKRKYVPVEARGRAEQKIKALPKKKKATVKWDLTKGEERINKMVKSGEVESGAYTFTHDEYGNPVGVSVLPTEKTKAGWKIKEAKRLQKEVDKMLKEQYKKGALEFEEHFKEWNKHRWSNIPPKQTPSGVAKMIKDKTRAAILKDLTQLKDITARQRGGPVSLEIYRVIDKVFGKGSELWKLAREQIITPLNNAKAAHTAFRKHYYDLLRKNITDEGILKGSKESEAVQRFGERESMMKKIQYYETVIASEMKKPEPDEILIKNLEAELKSDNLKYYTEDDLVEMFGKKMAQKIVDADVFFRRMYNELITLVNKNLEKMYPDPNVYKEHKIEFREDYYRHFQELASMQTFWKILFGDFSGSTDAFESVAGLRGEVQKGLGLEGGPATRIDPTLIGLSQFTKPRNRFLSIAQPRLGVKTTFDAVGGFLDYIDQASYTINIGPVISEIRNLQSELAYAAKNEYPPGTVKLDNFIEFLDDYANDLSGKLDPMDRGITKKGFSRKFVRILDYFNRRAKANTILGNLATNVVQWANMVPGIASAGQANYVRGIYKAVLDQPLKPEQRLTAKSGFLSERFFYKELREFDYGKIENARNFLELMSSIGDEAGATLNWYAHHEKAITEGVPFGYKDAVDYADDMTRKLVAGRGVGEVPLGQKGRFTQMVIPFQLEVANMWKIYSEFIGEAKAGGKETREGVLKLTRMLVYSYLFNTIMDRTIGRRVLPDPIQVFIDIFGEEGEGKTWWQKGGRIAGEALSNYPGGSYAADIVLPDDTHFRQMLFGEEDPTRFGSGIVPVRMLKNIATDVYKGEVPLDVLGFTGIPFLGVGGMQLKKMLEGLDAIAEESVRTPTGKLRYPVSRELGERFKTIVFGPSSTRTAGAYYDGYIENELGFLSDKQTAKWEKLVDNGMDPISAWITVYEDKARGIFKTNRSKIRNDKKLSTEEKRKKLDDEQKKYEGTLKRLEELESAYKNNPLKTGEMEYMPDIPLTFDELRNMWGGNNTVGPTGEVPSGVSKWGHLTP